MTGTLTCPHCGKTIECTAEDIETFASDAEVEAECPYCQKAFQVEMPTPSKAKSKVVLIQPSYQSIGNMGQAPSYPSYGEQLRRPRGSLSVNPLRDMAQNQKQNDTVEISGDDASGRKLIQKLIIIVITGLIIFAIITAVGEKAGERARKEFEMELDRATKKAEEDFKQWEFEQKYPWATEEGLRELSY